MSEDRRAPRMAVPKTIHLCWFGKAAKSKKIQRCLRSIAKLEQYGYTLRFWDESNYDVRATAALASAYDARRWSLVSNYARVDLLSRHGGIYLDTDIELLRPFDDLLGFDLFLGFMWDCTLGTAVIGAAPQNEVIRGILTEYDSIPGALKSPNNDTFTEYFLRRVPGFKLTGRSQTIGNIRVLDKLAFEQPSLLRTRNYTIHHFEQSWKNSSHVKQLAKRALISTCSLWAYRRYVCRKSLRISPFYSQHLEALQRSK